MITPPAASPPASAPRAVDRVRSRRLVWAAALVALGLGAAFLAVQHAALTAHVMLAEEQVRFFEEMKSKATPCTDPRGLCGYLGAVVQYYPSGTKQASGSRLDRIVETARRNAVAAITARLREITGRPWGDDVERWLREYPAR